MNICRIVNSVCTSNTYIITKEGYREIFVIDPGDYEMIKKYIGEKHEIKAVLLTHTHYDHIYGLPRLLEDYPECKVFTSFFGKEALGSSRYNFSKYHNDLIEIEGDNILSLSEGNSLKIFTNIFINVYETPGHDKSCLSYGVGENFFSGDSYIPGLKVITSFPQSDRDKAYNSLRRIMSFADGMNLFPGHGEVYMHYSYSEHSGDAGLL